MNHDALPLETGPERKILEVQAEIAVMQGILDALNPDWEEDVQNP